MKMKSRLGSDHTEVRAKDVARRELQVRIKPADVVVRSTSVCVCGVCLCIAGDLPRIAFIPSM